MPSAIAVAAPQKQPRFRLMRNRQKPDLAISPETQIGPFSGTQASPHQPSDRSTTQFDTITFENLERYSNQIANQLLTAGLRPGTRMALMVPPGIDFVACVFGMFKAGLVAILIDPGMGRKNLVNCLAEARPEGMVGIPLAHFIRGIFRRRLMASRHHFVLGRWPACQPIHPFQPSDHRVFKPLEIRRSDPAAIIFTTGSTGPPKGVLYRHEMFIEQARQIRDYFQIEPGSVDVSGFPLFALFNTAMGTTTVFPKMDATRPAKIDPWEFKRAAELFQANQSFGSPALWNTVTRFALKHEIRFPQIKRVLSAGAPVPAELLGRIKQVISPLGEAFTPYGATESLPVACNDGSTILTETSQRTADGAGTCVGQRFPDIQWKVIRIVDQPIESIDRVEELPTGQIGELIVSGKVVSPQYLTRTEANAEHKIKGAQNCLPPEIEQQEVWHRMGDVGYLDQNDRFWFCGRKSHRVQTANGVMYTIPCEAIINADPNIYRCGLVGLGQPGQQIPVIVAEPYPEAWPRRRKQRTELIHSLKQIAHQHPLTREIEHILLHRSLPVDIRHNSKIFREQLRSWAAKRI